MPSRANSSGDRSLRRQPDFLKLWAGETVSLFGSQITVLALPLTAVLTLEASAGELGLLNAARFAPFIAVVVFAGLWVDRRRRRPVLVWTNVGRGFVIALVPAGAFLDLLSMELLYAVGLATGALTVFFDVAYQSYLPSLVTRAQLTAGNSRLEASRSAADVGGPGIGGLLVQLLSAPAALLADAFSFFVSAATLSTIRTPEPETEGGDIPRTWLAIRDGFRFILRDPYVRPVAGEAATFNLFEQAIMTAFVVYAVRELDLSAGLLGLIVSIGAAGALAGAVLAPAPERRYGLGRTIAGSMAVGCTVPLALPLVTGPKEATVPAFAVVFFVWGCAIAVSNVHVVTLRQTTTPDSLLGRMNASYRFFTYGAIPLGALLGGFLGEAIGLREALFVASGGLLLALFWVVFSALPRLRELPGPAFAADGPRE